MSKGFIGITSIRCWSDSEVSLYWICGETREWKQFVQNRVLGVRSLVPPELWNHCASKDNPPDIPSRGASTAELGNCMWFTGPEWLKTYDESSKQNFTNENQPSEEAIKEIKRNENSKKTSEASSLTTTCETRQIGEIIDCERFSSMNKLLRTTAMVLKFVHMLKSNRDANVNEKPLTDYMLQAEELWLKDIQFQLRSKAKTKKWEREFGLYRDDRGILRCDGRLGNADLTQTQKHPAILDTEHYVTSLIVRDSHERVKHSGVKATLTEIRSKYWIVRARQYVRRLIHKCTVCRRQEGSSYIPPDPPALPAFRITQDHPFTYTGVDFAGPLYVKQSNRMEKVYMVIYTCAVSRAVHLDIVNDMTAEAFIRSFRRFTARRGIPREVKSDNGKTFKAASKQLVALFEIPEVKKYLSGQRVRWTFNLEKAPWWGGFFERLIKSVKRCLYKILKNARVTSEELYTVLTEIESTLNSRPLTFVSTEDLDEPITPSHLINGRRISSLPDADKPGEEGRVEEMHKTKAAKRVCYLRTLKEHLWLRWKEEYLLELRNSHRQTTKRQKESCIRVGDIVVIHDEKVRRVQWKLGRVEKLIEGKDGAIRGAVARKLTDKTGMYGNQTSCSEVVSCRIIGRMRRK